MSLYLKLRELRRNNRGSVAVEAAFALPVLFAMCFAIIETGRAMWMQNSLQDAVDAAARCGAVSASCANEAQIKSHAISQVKGFTVDSSQFTVAVTTCGMQVSANVPYSAQIVGLGPMSMNLTAVSCRPYSP